MITHYGLFWSERDVYWKGKRGTPSVLLGREKVPLGRPGAPTRAERKNQKDYSSFIGLYCLYGAGELLYVGEAGLGTDSTNLFSRLKRHRKGSMAGRWDSFSWFGRKACSGNTDNLSALRQLEAVAIAIINPGFNKQAGTFVNATQVFQVPHEQAEGDLDTKLTRLTLKIDELRAELA